MIKPDNEAARTIGAASPHASNFGNGSDIRGNGRRIVDLLLVGMLVVVALLAAVVFFELLGSGFVGDDWVFILMSRFTDGPWRFYVDDYSSTYFFRPNGMALWWASVAVFDNDPVGHYAINVALHMVNALLLYAAIAHFSGRQTGAAFAALFLLHPIGIGTAAWLSDRFDLLAAAGCLLGVIALERSLERSRGWGWVLLAWLLALGSKETGIALGAWLGLRVLLEAQLSRKARTAMLIGVVAPAGLYLLVRDHVLVSPSAAGLLNDPVSAVATGVLRWFLTLPAALGGGKEAIGYALIAAMAAVVVASWSTFRERSSVLVPALALFLAPALLQSPVTRIALEPDSLENSTNYRFFYLAFAAMLLMAGVALRDRTRRWLLTGAFGSAVAALAVALPAHGIATRWATSTSMVHREMLRDAIRSVESAPLPSPCRIWVGGIAGDPDAPRFLDAAIKASLPNSHPAQACAITASEASWVTLVPGQECGNDRWLPLVPREWEGKPAPTRVLAGFCLAVLADPGPVAELREQGVLIIHQQGLRRP